MGEALREYRGTFRERKISNKIINNYFNQKELRSKGTTEIRGTLVSYLYTGEDLCGRVLLPSTPHQSRIEVSLQTRFCP